LVKNQLRDDHGSGLEIDEILDHVAVPNRRLYRRDIATLAGPWGSGLEPALFAIRFRIFGQPREKISQPWRLAFRKNCLGLRPEL